MIPLPDWAPNIHPIVVHFPIALLVVAVLFDVVGLLVRKHAPTRSVAIVLYALGAATALAAFFTGDAAAEAVSLPVAAQATLTDHETWATRTTWFYGLFALARLSILWFDRKGHNWTQGWVHVATVLIGAGGLFFLVRTGDLGASMVFQYGVGVRTPLAEYMVTHDHDADHSGVIQDHDSVPAIDGTTDDVNERPEVAPDGSWSWRPGVGARAVLADGFRFLEGRFEDLDLVEGDSVLTLQLRGVPVLFVYPSVMGSVQADVRLNVEGFVGTTRLVYNALDADNYDFLAIEQGLVRQGRVSGGELSVFDAKSTPTVGWITVSAVADGRHSRGYLDDRLMVHGHDSPPERGSAGLRVEGRGSILLNMVSAQALR